MGVKDKIRSLDHEWERDYEEYEKNFKEKETEMRKSFEALAQAFSTTNAERARLMEPIQQLYDFLSRRNKKEAITPFQYKDEVTPAVEKINKVDNRHINKYKDKSEMSFAEKAEEIFSFDKFVYHGKYKKEYEQTIVAHQKAQNAWSRSLKQCEETTAYYEVALEITELYRGVLMVISNTVRKKILPELGGIKAFLYAEAVKEHIIYGDELVHVEPVDIDEYAGSKAYGKHYTFVKNAHDFYTLIVSYFTTPHLTDLLKRPDVTEEEKEDFQSKLAELQSQKVLLEDKAQELNRNMVFTEVENG